MTRRQIFLAVIGGSSIVVILLLVLKAVSPHVVCVRIIEGVKVQILEEPGFKATLSPHFDSLMDLKVGRAKFRGLRGTDCAFQEIPEIHSIFFITTGGSNPMFHVFDLRQFVDIEIPSGPADLFGYTLGLGLSALDHVSMHDSNTLVLRRKGFDATVEYELNLNKRQVTLKSQVNHPKGFVK